jgi:uncharacterized protein YdaU (DUF1376 family)
LHSVYLSGAIPASRFTVLKLKKRLSFFLTPLLVFKSSLVACNLVLIERLQAENQILKNKVLGYVKIFTFKERRKHKGKLLFELQEGGWYSPRKVNAAQEQLEEDKKQQELKSRKSSGRKQRRRISNSRRLHRSWRAKNHEQKRLRRWLSKGLEGRGGSSKTAC